MKLPVSAGPGPVHRYAVLRAGLRLEFDVAAELVEEVGIAPVVVESHEFNAFTAVPVYTPSTVSKSLSQVSIAARPLVAAVQRYQTDAPPVLPA